LFSLSRASDYGPAPTSSSMESRNGEVMEYGPSLGLDVREFDDLAPLFRFIGDVFSEVSGRPWEHRATRVSKPRFHLRIGKRGVDLLVELGGDLGGSVPGRGDAVPLARLKARQEIADGRNFG